MKDLEMNFNLYLFSVLFDRQFNKKGLLKKIQESNDWQRETFVNSRTPLKLT